MAARDFYHETVKQALIADGWSITHDPYFVQMGKLKGFIDLGAELLAAERDTSRIAVEIKNRLFSYEAHQRQRFLRRSVPVLHQKKGLQKNLGKMFLELPKITSSQVLFSREPNCKVGIGPTLP
jgi:hypothetical protein